MKTLKYPAVLTIAGSDSGGGAGIQADIKTFSALGCYGASAITAITVQNTRGVFAIHSVPAPIVSEQISAVIEDIRPMAIKIGMVHSAELAVTIAAAIRKYSLPVVLDPVMVATSGDKLIEDNTIDSIKQELFPLAHLVTPNVHEARILSRLAIHNKDDMRKAGSVIIEGGCRAVLVKGAHLGGEILYDIYLDEHGKETVLESQFINTINTHGTGCTLSSAIAAYVAKGFSMLEAIEAAKAYVHRAILAGREVKTGDGHGPLNHFFDPLKLTGYEVE